MFLVKPTVVLCTIPDPLEGVTGLIGIYALGEKKTNKRNI